MPGVNPALPEGPFVIAKTFASLVGTRFSLVSGGLACVGAVALVCGLLPGFVRYKSEPA